MKRKYNVGDVLRVMDAKSLRKACKINHMTLTDKYIERFAGEIVTVKSCHFQNISMQIIYRSEEQIENLPDGNYYYLYEFIFEPFVDFTTRATDEMFATIFS